MRAITFDDNILVMVHRIVSTSLWGTKDQAGDVANDRYLNNLNESHRPPNNWIKTLIIVYKMV